MPTQPTNRLKLHIEEATNIKTDIDLPAWDTLQTALRDVAGWQLDCVRGNQVPARATTLATLPNLYGDDAGELVCQPTDADGVPTDGDFAHAIGHLLRVLQETRVTLRQRELELATAIPVIGKSEAITDFDHRIQAILRGTVDGLQGHAAALYLLDDTTSGLKLRAHWGLSCLRFLEPARPLRGSVADLEALTGHAVVLEDTRDFGHWNVPEAFQSAVCVPVSSPDTLLGTLWFFANEVRDYHSRETQLLEIVAGRLAAELEQRVLIREAAAASRHRNVGQDLVEWHQERAVQAPPLVEGWQIAAQLVDPSHPRGDFHSWRLHPDQHLTFTSAAVNGSSPRSLATASLLQGAVRALTLSNESPSRVTAKLNDVLWSSGPGCDAVSLCCGSVDLHSGSLVYTMGGSTDGYILRPHGWEPIAVDSIPLGQDPDWVFENDHLSIQPGDVLLVISDRHLAPTDEPDVMNTTSLAETLLRHIHLSASELVEMATELIRKQCPEPWSRSILVIKRDEELDHQPPEQEFPQA